MKSIYKTIIAFVLFIGLAGTLVGVAAPQTAFAAADPCNKGFLGLPAWYRGLTNADCTIINPSDLNNNGSDNGMTKFVWTIVLNVVDMILRTAGLLAVVLVLVGGFTFITSAGDPAQVKKGKETITSALIGLVICICAVAIVNFVVGLIK